MVLYMRTLSIGELGTLWWVPNDSGSDKIFRLKKKKKERELRVKAKVSRITHIYLQESLNRNVWLPSTMTKKITIICNMD